MGFSENLSKWCEGTQIKLEEAVRQVVVLAAQGLILKSPVDTGRFRGNWNLGIGTADLSTSEEVDKSGSSTLGKIVTKLSSAESAHVFYITNNLPYAAKLEFGGYPNPPVGGKGKTSGGYSTQAPNGMVRVTLAELPTAVEQYLASIR